MHNVRVPQLGVRLAAVLALFASPVKSADQALFDRPESLQPAIGFWTRVYSEVDSLGGYVHDSENLGIVYETLGFNWYDSHEVQDRLIGKTVQRYRSALRNLAEGKRDSLGSDEQKVLALWGADASPETLLAAADNLRFQRGQADRLRDGIIRAGAWEQHISRTLRDAGLPQALAALPHVESSYNPQVYSRIGAAGLWQFTRFTGRHYLRVDQVVDERLDPIKSTEAAARLLQRYYSKLDSWPLAITAYNHGLSGVRRAVRETGSTDIGEIVRRYKGPRFGFASRNFYAAFLAASDVAGNVEEHFGDIERHNPGDYWVVKVPAFAPVSDLAKRLDVDTDTLKTLNPSLQDVVWEGAKHVPRDYPLRLPAETGRGAILALLAEPEGYDQQIPDLFYRVKRGDTLSAIALRYKHSVRELMALNNLASKNQIRIGQSLRLSAATSPETIKMASSDTGQNGKPVLIPASDVTSGPVTASP